MAVILMAEKMKKTGPRAEAEKRIGELCEGMNMAGTLLKGFVDVRREPGVEGKMRDGLDSAITDSCRQMMEEYVKLRDLLDEIGADRRYLKPVADLLLDAAKAIGNRELEKEVQRLVAEGGEGGSNATWKNSFIFDFRRQADAEKMLEDKTNAMVRLSLEFDKKGDVVGKKQEKPKKKFPYDPAYS